MHEALNHLGRCLQQFLGDVLPSCGPDWWDKAVLAQLTFRIEPGLKEALHTAADREHRSIAKMVEVLILDYGGRNGIAISEQKDLSDDDQGPARGRK